MSTIQENEKEDEPYFNFINSIKSDVTKEIYEYNLKVFMKFCNVEDCQDLFIMPNPQSQIIKHLMSLREKRLSSNSISTRLNAIYHFYDMNDVALNKKKINMFKGEATRKVVDRAYTRHEIKKILDVSDLRTKIITLLMATSGIRIGGLPSLRLKNVEKIDSIYKVTVYEGSNSQYFTFKIRWDESLTGWESKTSFGPNTRIRPVNFSTEHKNMLSNLHAIISKGYLAIEEKHDKLLTSLRTARAENLTLKKDQMSFSDLLDGLRLALKGYSLK